MAALQPRVHSARKVRGGGWRVEGGGRREGAGGRRAGARRGGKRERAREDKRANGNRLVSKNIVIIGWMLHRWDCRHECPSEIPTMPVCADLSWKELN